MIDNDLAEVPSPGKSHPLNEKLYNIKNKMFLIKYLIKNIKLFL
jgi:hypothetical protein